MIDIQDSIDAGNDNIIASIARGTSHCDTGSDIQHLQTILEKYQDI